MPFWIVRSIDRERLARFADHRVGADLDAGKRDVGGARAVLDRIAAPRDAGRIGIDEEQREAVLARAVAGDARRDDELAGAVAAEHDALGAFEHIAALAVGLRRGRDVGEIEAGLRLLMRERERQRAIDDRRDHLGLHRLARAEPQAPSLRE